MNKATKIPDENLPNWQKILLIIYRLSQTGKNSLKFEDIVVESFKRYPESFHLRGYKEYPDSGDLVHKPLYDMRKNGLLNANQKTFSLTNKGLETAMKLSKAVTKGGVSHFKPDRSVGKEIDRILSSDAYSFFNQGTPEKILDTDFLQYLGVSVHTSKNEFLSKVETMDYAIEQSKKFYSVEISRKLNKYHAFMKEKFAGILNEVSQRKERTF